MRGATPARMAEIRPLATAANNKRTAEGIAYARAWRIRNKPVFDAMYGAS
ncbi:hypothetical protein [Sphingomonas faeni]